MDLNKLHEEMTERFDRLEEKLDKHSELTTKHETDISWIKGTIKMSSSIIITIIGAIISLFFKGNAQ